MALEAYLQKEPEAAEKLQLFMSFKMQVHTEGDLLEQLKTEYIQCSRTIVEVLRKIQETVDESRKTAASIPELVKLQNQARTTSTELDQLAVLRKEREGKMNFSDPFQIGREKKSLDTAIIGHKKTWSLFCPG